MEGRWKNIGNTSQNGMIGYAQNQCVLFFFFQMNNNIYSERLFLSGLSKGVARFLVVNCVILNIMYVIQKIARQRFNKKRKYFFDLLIIQVHLSVSTKTVTQGALVTIATIEGIFEVFEIRLKPRHTKADINLGRQIAYRRTKIC